MAKQNESTAYWIVIGLSILFGSSIALLQGALYGVAGPCAALTNNLMLGVGISGMAINVLRMVFLASMPSNFSASSQAFFYMSGVFLAMCSVLGFMFVRRYAKMPQYSNN